MIIRDKIVGNNQPTKMSSEVLFRIAKILRSGKSDYEIAQELEPLVSKTGVNRIYDKKHTLLMLCPSVPIVQFFILKHARIEMKNKVRETPLIYFHGRNNEIFKFLLEIGADVNKKCRHGKTLLMQIAIKGDIDSINSMLSREDLDLEATDNKGISALTYAVEHGNYDTAKILIEHGAKTGGTINFLQSLLSENYGELIVTAAKFGREERLIDFLEHQVKHYKEMIKNLENLSGPFGQEW